MAFTSEITFERGPVAFVVIRFTGERLNMLKTAFQDGPPIVGASDNLRLSSGAATAEMKSAVATIALPALLMHTDFADVSESLVTAFNSRFGPSWSCVIDRTVEG